MPRHFSAMRRGSRMKTRLAGLHLISHLLTRDEARKGIRRRKNLRRARKYLQQTSRCRRLLNQESKHPPGRLAPASFDDPRLSKGARAMKQRHDARTSPAAGPHTTTVNYQT